MARHVMLRRHGAPDVLGLEEFEPTTPADGEVQVAVGFSGINFADLVMRIGFYRGAPPLPFVPGYEVAGTVAAVGSGVTGFRKGQRVAAAVRFGGYSSRVNVPASSLFKVPRSVGLDEAAAFPVQWLTAHAALHESARVRKGEKLLVHAGAGGVGLAAIALAKAAGCEVHATAGGPEKVAYLQEHAGVDAAYDHKAGPWLDAVGRDAFDVVLDPIGGKHMKDSLRAIRPGGRVVAYGASDTTSQKRSLLRGARMLRAMKMSAIPLLMHSKALMGLNLLRLWDAGMDLRPAAENILNSMVARSLPRPRVDKTFLAEDAAAAHQYIHDRRNIGKVLLRF